MYALGAGLASPGAAADVRTAREAGTGRGAGGQPGAAMSLMLAGLLSLAFMGFAGPQGQHG